MLTPFNSTSSDIIILVFYKKLSRNPRLMSEYILWNSIFVLSNTMNTRMFGGQNMDSIWKETAQLPSFKQLNCDTHTDVLVIGGGITGILCAYMLQQAGVRYVLAEARTICNGITQNTTAKLTLQHGLIYSKLVKKFGMEMAEQYLDANQAALEKYKKLCGQIKCDFEEQDSFVYSIHEHKVLEDELNALNLLGVKAELSEQLSLPFAVAGAVKVPKQAQFHPLKFISAIAAGLNIYEHTNVEQLVGTTAITNCGKIIAKKVIVATHFPFLNRHGSYFIKMYQHRSYVIALENAVNVNGIYVDAAQTGMSFRNYRGMLLIGGGGHRTGKKGGKWEELRNFARQYVPGSVEKCFWATQDCMTLDHVPYIGPYSANTPDLYVATGFNKWGMTSSMAAAMILTDLVQEKDNPYAKVFSPSRTILHPQLAVNVLETAMNMLTPTTKRCSHLGCALKWNACEHSWDCPCHGSRFTKNGELIDNPATDHLKL